MKRKKSLSAILGTRRVKKPASPRKPTTSSSASRSVTASPASSQHRTGASSSSVTTPLSTRQRPQPRKETHNANNTGNNGGQNAEDVDDGDDDDYDEESALYFGDKLQDQGLIRELVTDRHLADVPQAIMYILSRMWTPIPAHQSGMNFLRRTELLNYRQHSVPPVVSLSHLQAVLRSPSAVEREVAELCAEKILARVVIRRRSEGVVLVRDLETWAGRCGLGEGTRRKLMAWIRGEADLAADEADELVRTGWLVSHLASGLERDGRRGDVGTGGGLLGTRMRLEDVARAPTGSLDAVASSAVGMVTGTGTPTPSSSAAALSSRGETLSLAVPGNGTLVKLTTSALDHLRFLLGRSTWREMPETRLRELWDGDGVSPGRRRKWKDYYGLSFEFVLEEAVGRGGVEIFDTGSVGRGVRLV